MAPEGWHARLLTPPPTVKQPLWLLPSRGLPSQEMGVSESHIFAGFNVLDVEQDAQLQGHFYFIYFFYLALFIFFVGFPFKYCSNHIDTCFLDPIGGKPIRTWPVCLMGVRMGACPCTASERAPRLIWAVKILYEDFSL